MSAPEAEVRSRARGRAPRPFYFPIRAIVLWIISVSLIVGLVWGTYLTLTMTPEEGALSGAQWRALAVNGLARGSVYALIALGYTLVYGILKMINFAHGEVFMAGAFSTFFVARALDEQGFLNASVWTSVASVVILIVCSAAISLLVAVLLERVAYRPLRNAPRLVPLITAIGASLFLQYSFAGFYGVAPRAYPEIDVLQGTWTVLGFPIRKSQLIVILGAVLFMIVLSQFVARTRTGRSMRAVAEDKEIAQLMGVDVNRTIRTTFAIGGALAGVAGILFVFVFNQVSFSMGFSPGIKAFTAAVLGGIGSIAGAALGGLILGILEAVGPFLFLLGAGVPSPNQLQPLITFGTLVLVLLFKPGGILGSDEAEKL
jgi:branched-chain amino acid transport system permease protein